MTPTEITQKIEACETRIRLEQLQIDALKKMLKQQPKKRPPRISASGSNLFM